MSVTADAATIRVLDPNPRSVRYWWPVSEAPWRVLDYWRHFEGRPGWRAAILAELHRRGML
jgi:hypothetical protein